MALPRRVTSLLVGKAPQLLKLAPVVIGLVHKVMPSAIENRVLLQVLNTLAKDFIAQGELDFMHNKRVCFCIPELDIRWIFIKTPHMNKLCLLPQGQLEVDVTFSASLDAMVLMASQKIDPDTLFFNRQLQICGDTELGLEIKNLIDQFDISQLQPPMRAGLELWSNALLEQQYANAQ